MEEVNYKAAYQRSGRIGISGLAHCKLNNYTETINSLAHPGYIINEDPRCLFTV